MITLVRRLAALLAVASAGLAVPLAASAQDANKAAPAASQVAPATTPAPATCPARGPDRSPLCRTGRAALGQQGDHRKPLRPRSAVAPGRLRLQGHADHPGDHVDGQLVHHVRQAVGAAEAAARGPAPCRASSGRPPRCRKGGERLKEGSPFRYIAESGLEANQHHEGKLTRADRPQHLGHDVDPARGRQRGNRMQDGLAFLATVGSTAPFVGLFGTVWGIYHALTAIGIAGQASIDKVAGPVGEALIMTAIGLAVAVPAVLGYNWLVRRNKVAMEHVRAFGSDLHTVLMGGPAKAADALTRSAPRRRFRHGNERRRRRGRRRSHLRDQHHAAGRRDAGAADHLPDHHPGRDALGQRCSCPRNRTWRGRPSPRTS